MKRKPNLVYVEAETFSNFDKCPLESAAMMANGMTFIDLVKTEPSRTTKKRVTKLVGAVSLVDQTGPESLVSKL